MFDSTLNSPLNNEVKHNTMQETADLVTFTEEILDGKLYFLCSDK